MVMIPVCRIPQVFVTLCMWMPWISIVIIQLLSKHLLITIQWEVVPHSKEKYQHGLEI